MHIFIFAQIIGLIAWGLLVYSYYKKNIDEILKYQVVGGIFEVLHYFMLGAFSGLTVVILELIRDFGYYKAKNDKIIFILTIPVYFFIGYFSYNHFMDLLPVAASCVDGYALTNRKKIAVVGSIINNCLWLIYDLYCGSYVGVIAEILFIISNIYVMWIDNNKIKSKKIVNSV
ncbi:MAG: YgjV family protein [Bacilli bacterium]|nr:YgjV family protein [Bacilli bacterium]